MSEKLFQVKTVDCILLLLEKVLWNLAKSPEGKWKKNAFIHLFFTNKDVICVLPPP